MKKKNFHRLMNNLKQKPFYAHPSYIGYANTMPKDDRQKQWKKEYDTLGFDTTTLWNLDYSIICYILPRLKLFVEKQNSNVCFSKEQSEDMQYIIETFEFYVSGEFCEYKVQDIEKMVKALNLLTHYFFSLWN